MPSRQASFSSTDDELARHLVAESARALVMLRRTFYVPRRSWGPALLSIAGDRIAQAVLSSILAESRPHDAVRSEEAGEDVRRASAQRVWIIDPLDGSADFGDRSRTDWATQVALWEEGKLVVGAVALPALGKQYSTSDLVTDRHPASRSTVPDHGERPLRLTVSRRRPPTWTAALTSALAADLLPLGSCGAKVAAVLDGTADAYVHDGGQYEWDSAGPVAVAQHAGLFASRLDGSPLR